MSRSIVSHIIARRRGRPVLRLLGAAFLALTFVGATSVVRAGVVTTITVKETAGVGAQDFPTTVVVPLPEGRYQSTTVFSLGVPAQFQALERWATKDNSIRHLAVHFLASVAANGTATYTLRDDGGNPAPASPVDVVDGSGLITVTTGPLKFTVNKTSFDILDTVWYDLDGNGAYADGERIVLPSASNGGRFDGCTNVTSGACTQQLQNDPSLPAPSFTVEESGPLRAVIRAELPTSYGGVNAHTHGYVVRIYAWAGSPDIGIDYQLANAASGPGLDSGKWANPLYFNSLRLEFGLNLTGSRTVRSSLAANGVDSRTLDSNGLEFAYTLHDRYEIRRANGSTPVVTCSDTVADATNSCDSAGFMDVSDSSWGVEATIRNMWETWPAGFEISNANVLAVQLFPEWSAQWNYGSHALASSGLYWLDDMRAVTKQVRLRFHGAVPSDASLTAWARTVDRYPVPTIPVGYYRSTAVTLDLDGKIPISTKVGTEAQLETNSAADLDENGSGYKMGWDRWYTDDIERLGHPCSTGGGPASGAWFIASESPRDYWNAEREMWGEINTRPEWLGSDYTYAAKYSTVLLDDDPYCGGDWRAQGNTASYRIAGSAKSNGARDMPHDWSYHAQEPYWYTASPWLKDWGRFLGEFSRMYWNGNENLGGEEREIGHAAKNTIFAYRVTGDVSIIRGFADGVHDHYSSRVTPLCGELQGGLGSSLQIAFQQRQMQSALREFKGYDWARWAELFRYSAGYMEGEHYNYSRYAYVPGNVCVRDPGGSGGTAWNMVDVAAQWYWLTGHTPIKALNDQYVAGGVDGGTGPYYADDLLCPDPGWDGCWARRYYDWEEAQTRTDSTPPPAITNLSATKTGNTVVASWSAPAGAAYYYVVWADRPIVEAYSTDTTNRRNWWAAESVGSGTNSATFDVGSTSPVYVAVFSFDASDNMSAISNVAQADGTPPSSPPPPPTNVHVN